MTETVRLSIDGREVEAPAGASLLQSALDAGIYVPNICAHPDLPPLFEVQPLEVVYRGGEAVRGLPDAALARDHGCGLCVVEVEGEDGPSLACATPVTEGLVVRTDTARLRQLRQDRLVPILTRHPHACLTCAEREGCSREPCSLNVPVEERCCPLLGRCELQKVVEYVGIREDTPRYVYRHEPRVRDEPLFEVDYNLCISCGRCVRACVDLRGVGALGLVVAGDGLLVGMTGPSRDASACRYCGACVEVCPTGALMDKDLLVAEREERLLPCVAECPAGIDVPGYLRLVAEGRYAEAVAVVRERAPFPEVLGAVCFRPCEEVCRRGEVNEPVAICGVKRFAAERAPGGPGRGAGVNPSGKKVAILGSGPAGLTAAYYLVRLGHAVTVFEARDESGGMLAQAIPDYRLPREVLGRDLEHVLAEGVELRTGTAVGGDRAPRDLLEDGFDAVFIGTGAPLSKRIPLEGSDLEGVHWGLDFLRAVKSGSPPPVAGRLVVIGGGNVAIDVALTALRLGAEEVKLACLESRDEMPAFEWEIKEALEERVDIHTSWGPRRIVDGGDGRVEAVEFVRCTSVFDREGRFNPSFDEDERMTLEADGIILAVGQAPDPSFLEAWEGVEVGPGGVVEVDRHTMETSVDGVYAGGDAVGGPYSVVDAIAMGRRAAESMDRHLGGSGAIEETFPHREAPSGRLERVEDFAALPRAEMPKLPRERRRTGFGQVELGFSEEDARREAARCLQCDLRLAISPVVLPPEEWLEFTAERVQLVPATEGVFELLGEDRTAIYICGTPNLRGGLEGQLAACDKAKYFRFEEDKMYTKRESELIQQFLQRHGRMPELNDELDDLF